VGDAGIFGGAAMTLAQDARGFYCADGRTPRDQIDRFAVKPGAAKYGHGKHAPSV
jgi:hypothetical protein